MKIMDSSVIICLFMSFWESGLAIYFSHGGSSVSLSPGFWPENRTIHVLKAILEPDDSGRILYTISSKSQDLNCPDLSIHPEFGSLSILPCPKCNNDTWAQDKGMKCSYKAVAELKGKPGLRNVGKAELRLKLNMTSLVAMNPIAEDCSHLPIETICFAGSVVLNISVMENSNSSLLAVLGQLNYPCGTYYLDYKIKNSEVVSISKHESPSSSFFVWSQPFLDREMRESYNFSVECQLTSKETSEVYDSATLPGTLTVLDQDDNPIEFLDGSQHVTVFISFSQQENKFEPGFRLNPPDHNELFAYDKDTLEANKFTIKSLNDTKELLEFEMKIYKSPLTKMDSSAVHYKIKLSKKVTSMHPWDGLYCVVVQITDITLVIQHPALRYTICLHFGSHNPGSIGQNVSSEELKSKLERGSYVATLSRSANTYSAVMYPFPDLFADVNQLVLGLQFQVKAILPFDNENNTLPQVTKGSRKETIEDFPFDITEKSGIVYLVDPSKIIDQNISGFFVEIVCNSSQLEENLIVNLTIYLDGIWDNSSTVCEVDYCAELSDANSCKSSCGTGSVGNCSWWDYNPRNTSLGIGKSAGNILYSTCSSNLETCPDGKCDELESKYPSLCPQDCATEITGFGSLRKHENKKKYGVEHCSGVCTCYGPTLCSCSHLPMIPLIPEKEQRKGGGGRGNGRNNEVTFTSSGTSDPPNVHQSVSYKTSDHTFDVFETAEPECGKSCITLYASVSVSITIFIGSLILFACKRRSKKKRKSTQSVVVDALDVELSTGYGDHGGNRILISDTDYIGSERNGTNDSGMISSNAHFNPDHAFQVESKWEIPREDLILEHVIGEGEFGRVLKGVLRAVTGRTVHVAVKMLKVDHIEGNKSLRQEFMAEFSLLKQLDHPNVIKLLGACTSTGGPPYLVMEYAEFGSLRSFLRKCRKVEKISHDCSSEWCGPERRGGQNKRSSAEVQDFEYIVAPQEVLGFSWQIAKGMAYLSDMKMVHRDLAARNILVTKTKVCKISDFGLTRDIYVDDAYRKKSKDRVPVKWLAPECLTDELYTSKSDVWAFGILLYELTTLGASPYPGIQTEHLYSLLDSGYRMQQPINCSNKVYAIMRKCWGKTPLDRPSFHELVYELSRLLEDGIEYLKLDIPSVSNPGYDIFIQEQSTNASSSPPTAISERPHGVRRNSSMENLRLIDYENSTNDEFIVNQLISDLRSKHTYINNPSPSKECENSDTLNSSGYESPITLSTE